MAEGQKIEVPELEKRMRPGMYSDQGFLGEYESLEEIIDTDKRKLLELNVSYEQISHSIENLLLKWAHAKRSNIQEWLARSTRFPRLHQPETTPNFSLENLPQVDKGYVFGKFHVFVTEWRGFQNCPWGCQSDTGLGSIEFLILNRESGLYFTGSGLAVHLIRDHHFFEGKGVPYRIDPERAAKVLELY